VSADEHMDESEEPVNALRGNIDRSGLPGLPDLTAALRSCRRCQDALVELLPARTSLVSAARLLRAAPGAASQQDKRSRATY
jgi:hypothetical protein